MDAFGLHCGMTLERATEIFVQAFAAGKSRTHPYLATRVNDLWIMRDGPGKKRDPRKIEVVACGLSPEEAISRTQAQNLGWHFLCHLYGDAAEAAEIRAAYKQLGYRALGTEWMFTHDLLNVPVFDSEPPVRRVEDEAMWLSIRQQASQPRPFRPETRGYCIWDGDRDYGWVHSVPLDNDAWVSDLYVYADSRGQGYGRALMSRLLQDDRAVGVGASVLLASTAGARLYPHMGYRQIGELQLFCPVVRA